MLSEDSESLDVYFAHSAALRVMNAPERHAEIEEITGLEPARTHRRGEVAHEKTGRRWENDIWVLASPLGEEAESSEHLGWLWQRVRPHKDYFRSLVESGVEVDVFCGYRSNCDHCGFSLEPDAVEIARELGVRLEFSIIIA